MSWSSGWGGTAPRKLSAEAASLSSTGSGEARWEAPTDLGRGGRKGSSAPPGDRPLLNARFCAPEVVLCSMSAGNPELKHCLKHGVVEKRTFPPTVLGWEEGRSEPGTALEGPVVSCPALLAGPSQSRGQGLSPRGPGSSAQRGAPHVLPATPCPLPTPDAQGAKKDLIGSLSPYRASRLVRACPLGQTTNHGPPYKGLLRGQPANSAPARDKRQSRVSFRREHRPRSTESPLPIRGCWEVRGWPSLVYKIISHGLHMNLLS